jgi:hypothetical protein
LILQAFRNGRPKVTTASYNNAAEVSGVCQCHEPGILTGKGRVLSGLAHHSPGVRFKEL